MPTDLPASSPERIPIPVPERQPVIERPKERPADMPKPDPTVPPETTAPAAAPVPASVPVPEFQHKVEQVLEEGLSDLYQKLDPARQAKFRHEGEVTAQRVSELLQQAKVKVVEILRLIRRWLAMLPGVSSLFVESQAKQKAEKLLSLRR